MSDKKEKLYMMIYHDLINRIVAGELKAGKKLPAEIALAKQYGVGRVTVAHALKLLGDINIVYRVKKGGTYINGTTKHSHSQYIVPIILQDEPHEHNLTANYLYRYALLNNCFLPYFNSNGNAKKERDCLKQILKMNANGIIVYPCQTFKNMDLYAQLKINNVPIVFLDRGIDGIKASVVTSNNATGMYQIVKSLIDKGHRKIAYFATVENMSSPERHRFYGYCNAMIDNNVGINSDYIFSLSDMQIKYTQSPAGFTQKNLYEYYCQKIVNTIVEMQDKPTAVCCSNDINALTLCDMLRNAGIRIPEDISITGFDNLPAVATNTPPITTVAQNFERLSKAAIHAVTQLIEAKETPKKYLIDVNLIERESVKQLQERTE